ncbi:MAG: hypothetical protein WBD22_04460 [Pyrinomonadaceae bacterium]
MSKPKKRPSRAAKASKKIVENSKLLAVKAVKVTNLGGEFRPGDSATKTSEAIKPRPDKKRG